MAYSQWLSLSKIHQIPRAANMNMTGSTPIIDAWLGDDADKNQGINIKINQEKIKVWDVEKCPCLRLNQ